MRRYTQHTTPIHRFPPVWHTGQINLGYHHISLLNYPFFLYFLCFKIQVLCRRGTIGRSRCNWPHQLFTATTRHGGGVTSLLHLAYRTKTTHMVVDSTGESTEHLHIFFTRPIHHVGERLHSAPPPPWSRPPQPMGLNLGMYNIQYSRGFGIPQAIRAVKRENYDIMLLTERNIPDVVYYHNRLGYDIVFSEAAVTAVGGVQGGVGIVSR